MHFKLSERSYKATKASRKNVGENVGKNVGENLNKRECEILELISDNPTITQEEIASILSITVHTVERNIQSLRAKNKIKREGSHTKGSWIIIK